MCIWALAPHRPPTCSIFSSTTSREVIYLVGDIIDFWKVRRGPHWPQTHNDVVQKLLRQVRKGVRVVLIPGNHDEGLRDYIGLALRRRSKSTPVTPCAPPPRDGAIGVLHGDEFDVVVRDGAVARHLWETAAMSSPFGSIIR